MVFSNNPCLLMEMQRDLINPDAINRLGPIKCNILFDDILAQLTMAPACTTLRVNTLSSTAAEVCDKLLQFIHDKYEVFVHSTLADVVVIASTENYADIQPSMKAVIVGLMCGVSVLRGADVFAPGILGAPNDMSQGDLVAVYADLEGKCLKGATQSFSGKKVFVGNGVAQFSRRDLFVRKITSGIAIKMTEPVSRCPCLGDFLPGCVFLQNLPSIVCGHVLDPQPGEVILDMCASPGGKTIHLATLMKNQGLIVALDKTKSKVNKIDDNVTKFQLTCVRSFAFDATKSWNPSANIILQKFEDLREPPYPSESFDRILLDAPCSALGQRPQLHNGMTAQEFHSYPKLQKKLLNNAVNLLKPGGILVYSTCTFTLQENEVQVKHILQKYPDMYLDEQKPYLGHSGLLGADLADDELCKIQRFGCPIIEELFEDNLSRQHSTSNSKTEVNRDTIGFFIAKFRKMPS